MVRLVRKGLEVWRSSCLAEDGCLAIANLACSSSNREVLCQAGACELTIECLKAYPLETQTQVASTVFMAVANLSFDSQCREVFSRCGACPGTFITFH